MKNYRNKSTFKGVKSELTVKYGVSKSDDYASQNTNDAKTKSRDYFNSHRRSRLAGGGY